jgi:hypothetical protein
MSSVYRAGPVAERRNRVMRRVTAIFAIWVSLLGVAMPVLACAMGVSDSGCCPVQAFGSGK